MPSTHHRLSRLFLDRDLGSDRVPLTEREAHYLGSVLRLKRGDPVLAFNGRGQERHAVILSLARRGAELEILESVPPLPESALDLTLIQGLPKSEAMDLVVQKATELGVRVVAPVITDFSVVRLDEDRAARRIQHWTRIAQSACEQSGRHRPPEIRPVQRLEACLAALPASAVKLALDTGAATPLELAETPAQPVFLLVGPEGGLSPADLAAAAAHGFDILRLGPRVLRAESAALVGCALLQAQWGDLR